MYSTFLIIYIFLTKKRNFCFAGNRPHPASKNPPFSETDKRRQYCVRSLDPRVHFALVCGAKVRLIFTARNSSCGKVMFFTSVCQEFCPQHAMGQTPPRRTPPPHPRQTPYPLGRPRPPPDTTTCGQQAGILLECILVSKYYLLTEFLTNKGLLRPLPIYSYTVGVQ